MIRAIGLRGAVAVNIITMIGIGPLITIPLVLADLPGPLALCAWVGGLVLALCDGLVWAELGSLYPRSGGTYSFLLESFGRSRWGKLLAFLFAWQIVLSAPLLLASGYIGFAHYAAYLVPALGANSQLQAIVAAGVGLVTVVALYRPTQAIDRLGIALAGVAIATLGSVIVSSATHFSPARAFTIEHGTNVLAVLSAGLGPALVITLYDYYGYGQACTLGDEVRDTKRVLPLSVLFSLLIVGVSYVLLQIGVLGTISWHELVPATPTGTIADSANYVASTVVERTLGSWPARIVTVAILVTAFASTFGNLLGYSRIPFAAAQDGVFLRPFAILDEQGRFPKVSLVVIGLLALPACFLSLNDVINALTTGMTIVQSIAQVVAIFSLRARKIVAPYRMTLFPLPAIVALVGWIYIFCSAGTNAVVFGLVSLAVGTVIYLVRAGVAKDWPFAKVAAVLLLGGGLSFGAMRPTVATPLPRADRGSAKPAWGHARIVNRDGDSIFEVDGMPFFVYGAAFFYERLPRDQWQPSMTRLKSLGINTLDLYVPWNWHELSDGDFDFNGRTSPRRDLDDVLRLARAGGFKILLRPGPVVRNEWRNGGYPAWLLQRPEYGMPLHDLLEGRYPPTATLQNQHSDDAAAEWMANATHVKYSQRWLGRVLDECAPYADLILAVALDDDQGAYIDNQTYPAPHFVAYLDWLKSVVQAKTGPNELTFINTYQMKVPASSPVWAMGNWYQSEAYDLGEHDRAQLDFSTALLQTRPGQPIMSSEFQAGWLEQPDDVRPRSVDPENTSYALATMIGDGARGVVNFPAQDTLAPTGWEAPFSNWFYAWDAALALNGQTQPRASSVVRIGAVVKTFGRDLASAHALSDGAIVYLGSGLLPDKSTNATFASLENKTIAAQSACRTAGLSCKLVDPVAQASQLAANPFLIVPSGFDALLSDAARNALEAYAKSGGEIVSGDDTAPELATMVATLHRKPVVSGIPDARFAVATSGQLLGFLTVENQSATIEDIGRSAISIDGIHETRLPPFSIPPHQGVVMPIDVHLSAFDKRYARADRLTLTDCAPAQFTAPPFPLTGSEPEPSFLGIGAAGTAEGPGRAIEAPATIGPIHDCTIDYTIASRHATVRGTGRLDLAGRLQPIPVKPTVSFDPPVRPEVPLRYDAAISSPALERSRDSARFVDVFSEGSPAVVLDNGRQRVIIATTAGARAFAFTDDQSHGNCFTTVGALRDDFAVEPPLSTTDRIAKYTHQMPAGMFDRTYAATIQSNGNEGTAHVHYDAPDVLPKGAVIDRDVRLAGDRSELDVDERVRFPGADDDDPQRAVQVTSLAVGGATPMETRHLLTPADSAFAANTAVKATSADALGYYDTASHELVTVAWRHGDVEDATVLEKQYSIIVRLTLARLDVNHMAYGYVSADTIADAQAQVAAAGRDAQVRKPVARTN